MPHVRKADILGVVRELWGSTGVIEDEAKLVLAEKLVDDMWQGNKSGIPMNLAGQPVKQALGDRWLGSQERQAANMPLFSGVLAQDPYFSVKVPEGSSQPHVKLRISRLSQLITNPDLIKEYRNPGSETVAAGTATSSTSASAIPVQLTDEGLPIRPGQRVCQHYMKHGWCLFKKDCWYSHPPECAGKRKASSPTNVDGLVESHLEPGIMLREGVYPIRPNKPMCAFYLKNGWCLYKAKCRNNHPVLQPADAAAAESKGSMTSPVQDMPDKPLVKHPPTQLLLGVIIDSVWPPKASKEHCIKGQLAKHILQEQLKPGDVADPGKSYTLSMAAAGIYLGQWWPTQALYDPMTRPYTSLTDVLKDDPFYILMRNNQQVSLLLGDLISSGGKIAALRLSMMADVVWPPAAGRETYLRGELAKWLMTAGFSGEGGAVLRQVLAVGPDSPTVFRIDIAQAGEYLRKCWEMHSHPYDKSTAPWTQFKPLIAGDRFLYIEPAPGRRNSQHISIDLADMLENYPAIAKAARAARALQSSASAARSSSRAGSAGPSSSSAWAGSSSIAASSDDMMNLDDDEEIESQTVEAVSGGAWSSLSAAGPASSSSSTVATGTVGSSRAAPQQQPIRPVMGTSSSGSRPPSAQASSAGDPVAEAEADLAALQALHHEPPANMQWWWPEGRPEHPAWSWTEVAIRLLDSARSQAEMQLAEMTQHLEICPLLGLGCAIYKNQPHLLQFFAPHVSVGGLELPSTVYLIDIMKPGKGIQQVLDLVRPVLSSSQNTKVTHGSKLWSGQLERMFNIRLTNYIDTQQANFVYSCLKHEAGKAPSLTGSALKSTESASMSALMRNYSFYHPVRHTQAGQEQPRWQERPLSEDLITCAAADVAYLLPLMEVQVRAIRALAAEVQQHQQQRSGSRAAALMLNLPPAISSALEQLAAGAETRAGAISIDKIAEWGNLEAFHQVPLH